MKTHEIEFTGLADLDKQITTFKEDRPGVALVKDAVVSAQMTAMYLDKEQWERRTDDVSRGPVVTQIPYTEGGETIRR